MIHPEPKHYMTASTSIPTPKRSGRRSSLGGAEAHLPPTSIPAPTAKASPVRPTSVHVFGEYTPPPVPRIPSAHLKESVKRQAMLGTSVYMRDKERERQRQDGARAKSGMA